MHPVFASAGKSQATPIWFVHTGNFDSVSRDIGERGRTFVAAAGFEAKPGRLMLLPATDGTLAGALFGIEAADENEIDRFRPGQLSGQLPPGTYRFANAPHDSRLAALAFALGAYQFARYRKADARNVRLVVPEGVDGEDLSRIAEGVTLCRDLTNTPSNDMGPAELEAAGRALAKEHGSKVQVTSGDALAKNFPLVHAVGAGSARAPRLIDMTWGKTSDPKITLVGKGVCFDTGGLDIKPDTGMLNMKKDMGGAATALALAHMIMARGLKVRLRVIIPAVENSISGTSFRPRDIYVSRKGISVEIGNTDAEGRLILADALALADEDKPALIVDFATLTGAARVALGPEVAPFFTDDDALAGELGRPASPRTIRSGGCRYGGPTRRCSTPKLPTSTMLRLVAMLERLRPHCFYGASSRQKRGCTSIFSHGHRRPDPDARKAPNARWHVHFMRYSAPATRSESPGEWAPIFG